MTYNDLQCDIAKIENKTKLYASGTSYFIAKYNYVLDIWTFFLSSCGTVVYSVVNAIISIARQTRLK